MASRRNRGIWYWVFLGGLLVAGAMFSSQIKSLVKQIPYVGPMLFPDSTTAVKQ